MLYKQLCIAIVSQTEIEREGLRRILTEQSFEIVGVHRDRHELDLDAVVQRSDVIPIVLIDMQTEEESHETCHYVQARWPQCKTVMFAADCQIKRIADAFLAGIDGYVGKQTSCDSLAEMLKLVALGEKMVPSQVVFDLASMTSKTDSGELTVSIGEANLSDREVEILRGLIRGEPNKVISRRLLITEATVKVHVKSILRKVGVMNRTQAAIWGMSRGLSSATEPLETVTIAASARALNGAPNGAWERASVR